MKVIDLLNKIANGEEVPKKIEVGGNCYEFFERIKNIYDYKQIDIDSGKYFDNYLCDSFFLDDENVLNWEVEIIEEDKKIQYVGKEYDLTKFRNDYPEVAYCLRDLCNKTKEIIDMLNKE